jgi:hypothetical protein
MKDLGIVADQVIVLPAYLTRLGPLQQKGGREGIL